MLESVPFGGKVFIASGDWRQILPVVRRGTRASIIGSCLKRSYLWNEFKVLHLTINMRVNLQVRQPFEQNVCPVAVGCRGRQKR